MKLSKYSNDKVTDTKNNNLEIFHSLQGEGRNSGKPSVFIRLSLCNLHCYWCDTPYTWNWKDSTNYDHQYNKKYNKKDELIDLSIDKIYLELIKFNCSHYIFTGGEPLIQQNDITKLINKISKNNSNTSYEVETNGTIMIENNLLNHISQINVSPKLSNSKVKKSIRYKPHIITKLAKLKQSDFKFVISSNKDLEEAKQIINECKIDPNKVFLMPRASTVEQLNILQEDVSKLALKNKFNYSDRIHLRLYSGKRGF